MFARNTQAVVGLTASSASEERTVMAEGGEFSYRAGPVPKVAEVLCVRVCIFAGFQ